MKISPNFQSYHISLENRIHPIFPNSTELVFHGNNFGASITALGINEPENRPLLKLRIHQPAYSLFYSFAKDDQILKAKFPIPRIHSSFSISKFQNLFDASFQNHFSISKLGFPIHCSNNVKIDIQNFFQQSPSPKDILQHPFDYFGFQSSFLLGDFFKHLILSPGFPNSRISLTYHLQDHKIQFLLEYQKSEMFFSSSLQNRNLKIQIRSFKSPDHFITMVILKHFNFPNCSLQLNTQKEISLKFSHDIPNHGIASLGFYKDFSTKFPTRFSLNLKFDIK